MDWDTWLGVSQYHDYHQDYHQGQWRCWYDFGMGALGDWGAHILDTAHEFLELGLPYEINMLYANGHNEYFYPYSSTILFRFPQRKGEALYEVPYWRPFCPQQAQAKVSCLFSQPQSVLA